MRSIGVVTVGRTDWSIWRPVLDGIKGDPDLELRLYVTGSHLSPEFGLTIEDLISDGYEATEKIEVLLSSDSPQGVAKAMGLGILGFAQVFARSQPDILLVLGDRFETFAAVAAAMPYKIPVAHLHGGESTEGAIDQLIRHAITKMSHLHLPATQAYAENIKGMGEESWRVEVTGAPGIDSFNKTTPLSREEMADTYGIQPDQPYLVITYHPVTLEYEDTESQIRNLLAALQETDAQLVFTYPNADTSGRQIIAMLKEFCELTPRASLLMSMGMQGYASAMAHASAMVGNSSSGIIEAASFELPVVNIGNRQRGRLKSENVIDVGYGQDEIKTGIGKALSDGFRESLAGMANPYGSGDASRKIVQKLKELQLDQRLLTKVS